MSEYGHVNLILRLIAIALGVTLYAAASGIASDPVPGPARDEMVVSLSAHDRDKLDRIDSSLREIGATAKAVGGGALIVLGFLARHRADLRSLAAAILGSDNPSKAEASAAKGKA